MNMSWSQECVAYLGLQKETYLVSKNLVIRKRNLFDSKRKAFDF